MEESGIDSGNIDVIYKLVDIHKDIANEEYWEAKKEAMDMRYRDYEDEGYGRRRRDSRGRYMEGRSMRGNYNHHMPEMYWDRVMDGYDGYMEGRDMHRRGNYNGKEQSVESLERMLEGIVAFVEEIQNDPEQHEEKEVVNHYIRKLKEM